jgi:peptide/nickel transport system substrate-binding protein
MEEVKRLEQQFLTGQITRRDFIKRVTALGAAAAVSPLLLSTEARAGTPKKGGRLSQGLTGGSTTDTLDPATNTSNMNYNVQWQLRNNLVETDHNLQPIPELAESWDVSPDAKIWTFQLRKGVEFHNGKTMTSEDVVYSINHHRGEESKSAAKSLVSDITDVRSDGKYKVIIELSAGNAGFPVLLSDYHLTIFPKGTTGKDFEKGIGTGGYILEAWEPGVRSFARRNPNYWKEGRAHFDEVETLSIVDTNARTTALKTGEINYMDRCDLKLVHLLKRDPNINISAVTGTKQTTIPMLVNKKPFNDNNVRMALKLAIDREEIVDKVLRGYGVPGNDHPITPAMKYYAENLEQRTYDPDRAKHYMKKAGMLDHTFNLHAADAAFAGALDAAILYQEQAKKAGIKIKVVREPDDGYWSNVWRVKDFSMCYWLGRPTADLIFSLAYRAGAPWNDTNWENKRFNELLVAARVELDESKRRNMYWEMQAICRNDGGTIVTTYNQIVEGHSSKLAHGPISGSGPMDGCRNAERWWFKA